MTKEQFMKIVEEEGLKGPCAEDFWRLFDKSITDVNGCVATQARWIVDQGWKSLFSLHIKLETTCDVHEEARLRRPQGG